MTPKELTPALLDEIELLEPFGMSNREPVFGVRGIRGSYARTMGQDGQHLKFSVTGKSGDVTTIAWKKAIYADFINREPIDMAYFPVWNEWMGNRSIDIHVRDFSTHGADAYAPTTDELRAAYRFFMGQEKSVGYIDAEASQLYAAFVREGGDALRSPMLLLEMALEIFIDLQLLEKNEEGTGYIFLPQTKKLDIHSSTVYQRLCKRAERNGAV